MGRDIELAGFRLTRDEWRRLGQRGRTQLLRAMAEHTPPRSADDQPYESYELVVEAAR